MHSKKHRAPTFWRTLSALLLVTACGGEQVLGPEPRPATIELDRATVSFSVTEGDPVPAPVVVRISNGGDMALTGLSARVTYASGDGWLTASLDGTSAPANLTVSPELAGLTPGTYEATVSLEAASATPPARPVTVRLEVSAARPSIALGAVEGSAATPRAELVEVTNGGSGSLDALTFTPEYASGEPDGWLRLDPSGTTAPVTLTVDADPAGLAVGTYRAVVRIASPGVSEGAELAVAFEVAAAGARMVLSSYVETFAVLSSAPGPVTRDVAVTSVGTGPVTGLDTSIRWGQGPVGWLEASLDRTTAPATLTVRVDHRGLATGEYDAEVDVTSHSASKQALEIVLRVADDLADLTIEGPLTAPATAERGAAIEVQPVTYRNVGAADASAVQAQLYLSEDDVFDRFGDRKLLNIDVGDLPGGGGSVQGSVLRPTLSSVSAGSYWLILVVDAGERVGESDEANNTVRAPLEVTEPAVRSYTLDVSVTPRGAGRVTRSPDRAEYEAGTVVTLAVEPAVGYQLRAWTGDASGTEERVTVTMDRDRSVTAELGLVAPVLTGSTGTGRVNLSWTFEWPCDFPFGRGCLSSSQDLYELQESTTSANTGFTQVHVSPNTRQSPYDVSLSRAPGTYFYRVRAQGSGWLSPFSEVLRVVVTQSGATPPAAPSDLTYSAADLQVTFSWTDNADDEDGFRLHVSNRSDFATFSPFGVAANVTQRTLTLQPGTWYARVVAFNDQGESAPSPSVQLTLQAPPSGARFVNRTVYPVVSLRVNGTEQFPQAPQGLLPDTYYEMNLAPGTYSFRMSNGFWDGSIRFEMYIFSGQVTVTAGNVAEVVFDDPTVPQLLSRFGASQAWEGIYYDNGVPGVARFVFGSNGSWTLYDNGQQIGSGTVREVSRNPLGYYVEFALGSDPNALVGTLWELDGRITMRNGPPSWPLIEYFPVN